MRRTLRLLAALICTGLVAVVFSLPASAVPVPVISGLSVHRDAYWGGRTITVTGANFAHVRRVLFGSGRGTDLHVVSATRLTVEDPTHGNGTVTVRVVTSTGESASTSAARFTFTRPSMSVPIQGGLTGRQEQRLASALRRSHHGVRLAAASTRWTAAIGRAAMLRARSWLGMPYSWAGGNGNGPTDGVCAHNGGDEDCQILGFDCSGLTLYAWWPYRHLVHYAASQYRAGRFHPSVGELVPGDLVFFAGYLDTIGHVAIYEGNGMVVEAPQSGMVVRETTLAHLISIDGPYRGATRPLSTGRQGAVPAVTAVTSAVPTRGGWVHVLGHQLRATVSVSFGARPITAGIQRSTAALWVRAPAHAAGRVDVTVSTAWGTSTRSLTYVAPPRVTGMSTRHGPTTGGTMVTLAGAGLATVRSVRVGGTAARFVLAGHGRLIVTTPAHAAGPVTVALTSRYGHTSVQGFRYVRPTPTPAPTPKPTPPSPTPPSPTSPHPTSPSPPSPPPSSPSPTPTTTSTPTASPDPTPTDPTPTDPTSSDPSISDASSTASD